MNRHMESKYRRYGQSWSSWFRRLLMPSEKEWGTANDVLMAVILILVTGLSLYILLWT